MNKWSRCNDRSPPYSSGTFEKEEIRPRMIMAIINTHCHADRDAGTFQKVMTGSRVSLITTPTIYKSLFANIQHCQGYPQHFYVTAIIIDLQ